MDSAYYVGLQGKAFGVSPIQWEMFDIWGYQDYAKTLT